MKEFYTTTTEQQLRLIESIKDNYFYQTRGFCAFIRDNGLAINYESIRSYFDLLNKSEYAVKTIKIKRAAILSRVRLIFKDEPINDRIRLELSLKDINTGTTRAPKVNSNAVTSDRILSPIEYSNMLDGARSERQRLWMMTLWATGITISELTGINLSDCNIQKETVKIRISGRSQKERFVFLPTDLYERIRSEFKGSLLLFATGPDKKYSRNYITSQLSKLGDHLLEHHISAHSFRHSFGMIKIKETGKIQAVSQYLGHSSTALTLDFYCHEELSNAELFG